MSGAEKVNESETQNEEKGDKGVPLFSFIIPAYNAEKTLRTCIEEIYKDIVSQHFLCEVIVVENGSTDSTNSLLEHCKKDMPKLVIIHSKKGVSKARNAGIMAASGKKLIFVDADDCWKKGSLKQLDFDLKKYSADLYAYSYSKNGADVLHLKNEQLKVYSDQEVLDCRMWMISRPTLRGQVWSKVFDADIIKKNRILFNEQLCFAEDSDFLVRYTKCCKNIVVSNTVVYEYNLESKSVTRSYNPLRSEQYIKALLATKSVMVDESVQIQQAFTEYILINLNVILVHDVFDLDIKESVKDKMKHMNMIISREPFKTAIRTEPFYKCFSVQLLPEMFIKLHINLAGGLLCYIRAYLNHQNKRE